MKALLERLRLPISSISYRFDMFPKLTLASILMCLSVAACMPADPMTGVDMMKGAGSMSMSANGTRSFTYVIPANAYNGIVDGPSDLRKQHEWLIGTFLAEGHHCPGGYRIIDVELNETVPAYVYQGVCR